MCDLCEIKEELRELRSSVEGLRAALFGAAETQEQSSGLAVPLLDPRRFLTGQDAAEYLNLSRPTLDRWRAEGTGPPFAKFGRRVLYRADDLRKWAEERIQRPNADT